MRGVDARHPRTVLEQADLGPVDRRAEGQLLLREPGGLPRPAQVRREAA
jgi:hypothetical protein